MDHSLIDDDDGVDYLFACVDLDQGGIKCGNRGTGFLDSEGSHR